MLGKVDGIKLSLTSWQYKVRLVGKVFATKKRVERASVMICPSAGSIKLGIHLLTLA